ncbi:proline-rich protein HaeIII subfamily 1-like [Neovison vison]|uniref:proline-rich protein HaeIII subfamily 1-like n=1 Tax=Neovison vison TaxID=452646 RepID=UPI001CEFE581|nr:proline-rich protein HaeIII subfamily 1-like [Neogale vison]
MGNSEARGAGRRLRSPRSCKGPSSGQERARSVRVRGAAQPTPPAHAGDQARPTRGGADGIPGLGSRRGPLSPPLRRSTGPLRAVRGGESRGSQETVPSAGRALPAGVGAPSLSAPRPPPVADPGSPAARSPSGQRFCPKDRARLPLPHQSAGRLPAPPGGRGKTPRSAGAKRHSRPSPRAPRAPPPSSEQPAAPPRTHLAEDPRLRPPRRPLPTAWKGHRKRKRRAGPAGKAEGAAALGGQSAAPTVSARYSAPSGRPGAAGRRAPSG